MPFRFVASERQYLPENLHCVYSRIHARLRGAARQDADMPATAEREKLFNRLLTE